MKRIGISIILALSLISMVSAKGVVNPDITNPRMVIHPNKHLMQIKWKQYVITPSKLVIAFKLTNYRGSNDKDCTDGDTAAQLRYWYGYRYCTELFNSWESRTRVITVEDRHWNRGDSYFLEQYDFTSHNTPYGPYKS